MPEDPEAVCPQTSPGYCARGCSVVQGSHFLSLELRFTICQKAGLDQIDLQSPAVMPSGCSIYNLGIRVPGLPE